MTSVQKGNEFDCPFKLSIHLLPLLAGVTSRRYVGHIGSCRLKELCMCNDKCIQRFGAKAPFEGVYSNHSLWRW
jgi:hypothetical protein